MVRDVVHVVLRLWYAVCVLCGVVYMVCDVVHVVCGVVCVCVLRCGVCGM